MGEDAVQRLLPGVARGTDDGCGGHGAYYAHVVLDMRTRPLGFALEQEETAATLRARWNGYSSSTQATSP